jgi:hypothetical protein
LVGFEVWPFVASSRRAGCGARLLLLAYGAVNRPGSACSSHVCTQYREKADGEFDHANRELQFEVGGTPSGCATISG